jgi:hypothetical protein
MLLNLLEMGVLAFLEEYLAKCGEFLVFLIKLVKSCSSLVEAFGLRFLLNSLLYLVSSVS